MSRQAIILLVQAAFIWPGFAASLGAAVGHYQRMKASRRRIEELQGRIKSHG